jgi:hypothetical protein
MDAGRHRIIISQSSKKESRRFIIEFNCCVSNLRINEEYKKFLLVQARIIYIMRAIYLNPDHQFPFRLFMTNFFYLVPDFRWS